MRGCTNTKYCFIRVRIKNFLFFFIVTLNLKNAMYPRIFLCEEVKIKQHTSSKKKLFVIGKEAIWVSRFTCFILQRLSVKIIKRCPNFYRAKQKIKQKIL